MSFGTGNDAATFAASVDEATIKGGAGADTFDFNGAVGAATIDAGAGADTLTFTNVALNGTTLAGGTDNDAFSGNVTIGASGVSFWGGLGDDTFNFTSITNGGGTAYFWNEGGTDSIVLGGALSTALEGAPVVFGITVGSSMIISFAAGAIDASATSSFGAGTMSGSFSVANSNTVLFGFGSSMTTIAFAGGSFATLQGGVFETAAGTNIFDTASASTGTGLFGVVGAIPTFS